MDPNACLRMILEALHAGDMDEARDAATNMKDWLDGDGFPPRILVAGNSFDEILGFTDRLNFTRYFIEGVIRCAEMNAAAHEQSQAGQ